MRNKKLLENLNKYCLTHDISEVRKNELVIVVKAISERELKPISETKFGEWLKENAPELLDAIGDLLPEKGIWKLIKKLIDDLDMVGEKKSHAMILFEEESK